MTLINLKNEMKLDFPKPFVSIKTVIEAKPNSMF